jgi:hypothetical protein
MRAWAAVLSTLSTLSAIASPAMGSTYRATAEVPSHGLVLDVIVRETEGLMEVTMRGPADRWFAWGFGATSMSGTYTIVANSGGSLGAEERKLGNHTAGVLLATQMITWESTVTGPELEVISTRELVGVTPDHYTFDLGAVESGAPIDMIWGRGTGTTFTTHGSGNRGSTPIAFVPDKTAGVPPEGGVSWGLAKLRFERVDEVR